MSTELKTENNKAVVALLTMALLICASFQFDISNISIVKALLTSTASALISALLLLLTYIVPCSIKHKIIFTRFVNEMPAGRIHKLCRKDPRIDYQKAVKNGLRFFQNT